MSLNRFQKSFIRLCANRRRQSIGIQKMRLRKPSWNKKMAKIKPVTVIIVNAVTGEQTTAKSYETSRLKLKKQLMLRNVRAQFTEMIIHKNSIWDKMTEEEFKDYPVIVKVGNYQAPYLINYIGSKLLVGNKTQCTLYLKTVDNIDYLSIISAKKELLGDALSKVKPVKKAKKKKKKKKETDYDNIW